MSLEIRRVADNNMSDSIGIINNLDSRCFYGEDLYPKDGSHWWLAYDNYEPIGFAGITIYDYIKRPAVFLCRSGVIKNYRGLGLQKRLIRVREKAIKSLGYNRIITYTSYDNIISANNLIKCGYFLYTPDNEWGIKNGLYFEKYV